MNIPAHLIPVADGVLVWAPAQADSWGLANCTLIVSGGEAALVDTPYTTRLAEDMMAAARPHMTDARAVGTVINTHSNGDHCFSNSSFPSAEIITTAACAQHAHADPTPAQMQAVVHGNGEDALARYMPHHFGRFDYAGIELAPATRTFSGQLALRIGGTEVTLLEVGPAHTQGDLIAFMPQQRVVCAGDVVFTGDHPVHWAGPLASIMDVCQDILALDPEVIVPGHGPLVGPDGLHAYMSYLHHVRNHLHAAYARRLSVEDAAAAIIAEGRYPELGLPERLVVLADMEYEHLAGISEPPDILGRLTKAARFAQDPRRATVLGSRSVVR
ncbi:MBL fold metallo-hydrolase [Streptomyces venezuelae]|uniref:MBL fold metallo-hydrolase n=1 Tax=Streptomyces venezuelae TaxID=54571 RepID=UPI003414E409